MNKNSYRLPILVVIGGVLIIIVLSIIYVLSDGGSSNKGKSGTKVSEAPSPSGSALPTPDPLSAAPSEELHTMNGIIKGIDLDNAIITVQQRGSVAEYDFFYNGATSIETAYGKQITAVLLSPGDFVVLSYNDEFLLRSVTGSKDVDIYKNILQRTQDTELKKMTVADTIYRYGDNTLVLNDGYFVSMDTIEDMDIISIYSVDDYIYLINIEKGHGYFKMSNHSYFLGGTLKIGKYMSCEITEDLYLTLPEDEYLIAVEYEDFIGQATVTVERDMTTVLDMSAYTPEAAQTGFFRFDISPAGSLLYIDGVQTPYETAVELPRGEHWIQVSAGGYTPYTGFINVGDALDSLSISLMPAPTPIPDILYEEDESETATPTPDGENESSGPDDGSIADSTSDTGEYLNPTDIPDDNTDGDETPTDTPDDNGTADNTPTPTDVPDDSSSDTGTDGDHIMVIKASEGAAVFIDDVYKGVIENGELSLPKKSGTHTVRLTKEGYITRRYTIYVEDDGEDAEFAFPEMVSE